MEHEKWFTLTNTCPKKIREHDLESGNEPKINLLTQTNR